MDLAKTNCFGPPLVPFGYALAFGAISAIFLTLWWRRFGTTALLGPWGLLSVAGMWLLVLRLEIRYAFADGWWWSTEVAAAAVLVVLTPLLATLASAATWSILPRAPRAVHLPLAFAQWVVALVLAASVAAGVEEVLYAWR